MESERDKLIPGEALEAEPHPAYVVDREGRIAYVNSAWDREALRAHGPLGSDVVQTMWLDHIAGEELKAWHQRLLTSLLQSSAGKHAGRRGAEGRAKRRGRGDACQGWMYRGWGGGEEVDRVSPTC
jgi:hypothetical protein